MLGSHFQRLVLSALILLAFFCPMAVAQTTLIHAGTMIDGLADEIVQQVTIIVADGKIERIDAGYTAPKAGEQVIDLKAYTVLPGLIDLHTHHSGELTQNSYNEGFRMNEGDYAFRMVGYAEKTLLAGFTTVRELGDDYNLSIKLRRAVQNGWIKGPRVFAAGKSLATTGGHADPTNGLKDELKGDPGPKDGVVNGPDDARKAVRQRYKDGADWIKITATGGVLSEAKSGQNPQFTEAELRVIVETARDYGIKVAAHAHGAEGMKRAIRAGVATIEHGSLMDDEGIALMKQHGTYLVPTLLAGKWVTDKAMEPGFLPEVVRPKAAAIGPRMQATFAKAYSAGVKIAFGTDSGVSPHGLNAIEFELMVQAGMPPMAAIKTATSVAAEVLDATAQLGSLSAGKAADIIAVAVNPLDDIRSLQNVAFVMKEGAICKRP